MLSFSPLWCTWYAHQVCDIRVRVPQSRNRLKTSDSMHSKDQKKEDSKVISISLLIAYAVQQALRVVCVERRRTPRTHTHTRVQIHKQRHRQTDMCIISSTWKIQTKATRKWWAASTTGSFLLHKLLSLMLTCTALHTLDYYSYPCCCCSPALEATLQQLPTMPPSALSSPLSPPSLASSLARAHIHTHNSRGNKTTG
jgi:hypothetical protein